MTEKKPQPLSTGRWLSPSTKDPRINYPVPRETHVAEFRPAVPVRKAAELRELKEWEPLLVHLELAEHRTSATVFANKLRAALRALERSIESRPRVLSGVPVFKGTRFSIPQFFAELAEGESIDSIADELDVDRESLSSVLHALAVCLNQPMPR